MGSGLVTAIDIGSDSVCVASVRMRKGEVQLVSAGMEQLPQVEPGSPEYESEVAAAVNRAVKKNGVKIGSTIVGMSGRGTMLRYLTLPAVPPWKLSLMMSFEVEEQVGANKAAGGIAYDYRILSIPNIEDGTFPVMLALAQTAAVEERMKLAGRCLRRRIDMVGSQALGAFNAFARSSQCDPEEISLLLDVGAEETHLTMQEGPSLLFARTISFGGRQITARIRQDLGLLAQEAEEYKRNEACIVPRNEEEFFAEESVKASRACRVEAGQLANAVQSSLRFFMGTYKAGIKPVKVYLTGGGSRLGGLADALGELLKCEAEVFDLSQVLKPVGKAVEAMLSDDVSRQFSGAVGLAAGVLPSGFSVSLLPPKVRDIRDFWSHRIYVWYAGVLAAAALVMFFLGGYREAGYAKDRNESWKKHLKGAENEHKKLQQLDAKYRHLFEKLSALRLRESSGRDLLKCMNILRENTTPDIFFYEMETSGSIEDDLVVLTVDEKAKGKGKQPVVSTPNESFQKSRHIIIRGYIVGAKDKNTALEKLKALRTKLESKKFFDSVESRSGDYIASDSEEVLAAYRLRIFDAKKNVNERETRERKVPKGYPLRFALKCLISKEG